MAWWPTAHKPLILWMPGFGIGWAPAIAFNDEGNDRAILNAYVTPIPETRKEQYDERHWNAFAVRC